MVIVPQLPYDKACVAKMDPGNVGNHGTPAESL